MARWRGGTQRHVAAGRNRRSRRLLSGGGVLLLAAAGASLDPAIIPPFGPLASSPERIEATFTRCGRGRAFACVVDGDTVRFGQRRVRIVGIDAPEIGKPLCPGEAALGQRAADRLVVLLNEGPFDMTAHRFNRTDKYGRDLMVLSRGSASIGQILIDESLAHRYVGMKRSWC